MVNYYENHTGEESTSWGLKEIKLLLIRFKRLITQAYATQISL